MKRKGSLLLVLLVAALHAPRYGHAAEATITSDELEIQNNGERTIFRGHVVLVQTPYEVHSDQMVRVKETGVVNADGHVVGSWVSPKSEHVRIDGEQAVYDPATQTVQIWGKQQVAVELNGEKGHALFHGNRGWAFTQTPGKARLTGQVTGHVVPAAAS